MIQPEVKEEFYRQLRLVCLITCGIFVVALALAPWTGFWDALGAIILFGCAGLTFFKLLPYMWRDLIDDVGDDVSFIWAAIALVAAMSIFPIGAVILGIALLAS